MKGWAGLTKIVCMDRYFLLLLLCLGGFACNKINQIDDVEDVDYEAQFAIPLINTQFTMQQALDEFDELATIIIDEDGLIRLRYRGDVLTQTSEEVFEEINASIPPVIPVLDQNMMLPIEFPEDIELDQILLGSGTFAYRFENDQNVPLDVTFTLPEITAGGEALTFTHTIAAHSGQGPRPFVSTTDMPLDLTGYSIVPSDGTINIEYQALDPMGESRDLVNFVIVIDDITFGYAEGYLGRQVFEGGGDTIFIDFFNDDLVNGSIFFEDPSVTFIIRNSFGVPTEAIVNQFDVFTVGGEVLPIESELIDQGIDFPFPGLDMVGASVTGRIRFDNTNSNIVEVMSAGPTGVAYDVDALLNPDENPDIRGFITDSSFYEVQVEVDLPLFGRTEGFVGRDSFELSLDDIENAKDAELKIVAENTLPIDVILQGFFLETGGQVLDSLFADGADQLVESAPVDDNGNVTGITEKITFVSFEENRFDNVKAADQFLLIVTFVTARNGQEAVRIEVDQGVEVRVGSILTVIGDEG